jgi:hypothetical protein
VKIRRIFLSLLCGLQFFVLMIAFERPALAYVDPGSGLLVFQIAGSMMAGALFVLRSKLRRLFRRDTPKEEETSTDSRAAASDGNRL